MIVKRGFPEVVYKCLLLILIMIYRKIVKRLIYAKNIHKNFIATAFQPVGTALYVFGGAWDYQDVGTAFEGRTIGLSKDWIKFFNMQKSNYTYKDELNKNESYYPFNDFNEYYYAGLDCSGFVGWVIYNTLNSESLTNPGFVMN